MNISRLDQSSDILAFTAPIPLDALFLVPSVEPDRTLLSLFSLRNTVVDDRKTIPHLVSVPEQKSIEINGHSDPNPPISDTSTGRPLDLVILEEFLFSQKGAMVDKVEARGIVSLVSKSEQDNDHSLKHESTSMSVDVRVIDGGEIRTISSLQANKSVIHSPVEDMDERRRRVTARLSPSLSDKNIECAILRYFINPKLAPDVLRARSTVIKGAVLHRVAVQVIFNPKHVVTFTNFSIMIALNELVSVLASVKVNGRGSYSKEKQMIVWSREGLMSSTAMMLEVNADISLSSESPVTSVPISIKGVIDGFLLSQSSFEFSVQSPSFSQGSLVTRTRIDYRFL